MRQTIPLAYRTPYAVSTHLQDAALNYAQHGWKILPLHHLTFNDTCTCDHRQCLQPGQHLYHVKSIAEASRDPATIASWWQQDARSNVGLATGDGLLVIELDRRRVRSLDHFRQQYAIPETAIVRTEYGDWQLYFTHNRALTLHTTSDQIGPGIRTYGEGDYVVAPPSILAAGPYYWQHKTPLARLPVALLPFVLSPRLAEHTWSHTPHQPSQAGLELARTLVDHPLLWCNHMRDE